MTTYAHALHSPVVASVYSPLAIFVHPWTIEAAAHVCQLPDMEMAVSTLRLQGLAKKEGDFYSLCDYARGALCEQILPSEMKSIRARFVDYYLGLARDASFHLEKTPDVDWLSRLDREGENLCHAWTMATGRDALELSLCVWRWLKERGKYDKALDMLLVSLSREECLPVSWTMKAYRAVGVLYARIENYTMAQEYLELSKDDPFEVGYAEHLAQVENDLGILACTQGDYAQAGDYHRSALSQWKDLECMWGQAASYNGLGAIALKQDDLDSAYQLLRQSACLFEQLDDHAQTVVVLNNMGMIAAQQGKYEIAEKVYTNCLALFRKLNDPDKIAASLLQLGDICGYVNKSEIGLSYLQEAIKIWMDANKKADIAISVYVAASNFCRLGNYARASRLFTFADDLHNQLCFDIPVSVASEFNQMMCIAQSRQSVQLYGRMVSAGRKRTRIEDLIGLLAL